jgi:hypothetical protein
MNKNFIAKPIIAIIDLIILYLCTVFLFASNSYAHSPNIWSQAFWLLCPILAIGFTIIVTLSSIVIIVEHDFNGNN